jgi:site-specific DNA recombinase
MVIPLNPPLVPKRRGGFLKVLIIARISTEHQDVKSLADQTAKAKDYVWHAYSGKVEWKIIQSRGSGEHLDRKELLEAEELIESGEFDLVISEDLARICRRKRAYDFCELCLDRKTRLIAINDRIDTAVAGWEDAAFISTWHHERSNRETSQRIQRSLRARFSRGEVFQFIIYGYIKKAGKSTEADVSKDPSAESIYDEWFRRLEDGASYSEIADWLNDQRIATGPFSRGEKWTCMMVARITNNPLLKGVRVRNKKKSQRINKTGRHVSVDAPPEERLERICPHLAFIDPERYDRVIALLKRRNARYKRKGVNGIDPRKGISKKRTIWPGQHLRCGICNAIFYWTGVGEKKVMKCSRNQSYQCWNGIEVNGELVAKKLTSAIFREIMNLRGFDDTFLAKARQQWQDDRNAADAHKVELARRKQEIEQKIGRITDAIAISEESLSLLGKLHQLEKDRDQLLLDISALDASCPNEPTMPSLDVIKAKAKDVFTQFAPGNPELGRLMQILIPVLKVYPVRLCDGRSIVLRARVQLNLTALSDQPWTGDIPAVLRREISVDLFDPPQREQFRTQVVQMRATGMTEQQVADQLGITKTAAQHAAALQRKMDEFGLVDPYVPVLEPTSDCGLRRHLHPRFKFEPLDDDVASS